MIAEGVYERKLDYRETQNYSSLFIRLDGHCIWQGNNELLILACTTEHVRYVHTLFPLSSLSIDMQGEG